MINLMIGCSEKIGKFFSNQKLRLNFNPGLALIGLRTIKPRHILTILISSYGK